MKKPRRYEGDEGYVTVSMSILNYRSYDSHIDALQKAINDLSRVKDKIDMFALRNIRFDHVNGEFIVKVEVLRDYLDLGLEDDGEISNTSKALKIIQDS